MLRLAGLAIFLTPCISTAYTGHSGITNSSAYTVGQCKFAITDMFGGHFDISHESGDSSNQQGMYYFPATGRGAPHVLSSFNLNCQNSRSTDIDAALGAKQVSGKWMRYHPFPGRPDFVPFHKQTRIETVTLDGETWRGIALTVDATTGDEQNRTRNFRFCLIHKTQALCGDVPVALLTNLEDSDLWKAKAILQSIKFID